MHLPTRWQLCNALSEAGALRSASLVENTRLPGTAWAVCFCLEEAGRGGTNHVDISPGLQCRGHSTFQNKRKYAISKSSCSSRVEDYTVKRHRHLSVDPTESKWRQGTEVLAEAQENLMSCWLNRWGWAFQETFRLFPLAVSPMTYFQDSHLILGTTFYISGNCWWTGPIPWSLLRSCPVNAWGIHQTCKTWDVLELGIMP